LRRAFACANQSFEQLALLGAQLHHVFLDRALNCRQAYVDGELCAAAISLPATNHLRRCLAATQIQKNATFSRTRATSRALARDSYLAPPPRGIEPELCKLVTTIPAAYGWAHGIKFDGFRMHTRIVKGRAALLTRNGLDWTAKYPHIAAAIGALNCRQAYVDGELCAVLPDGTTSFAGLQGHGDAPAELVYFAFDLLHLDGEDLMRLPLLERKARLEALLADAPPVLRFSGHIIGNGARVFEEGSKLGVEGMVSKQVDKSYLPGNRGIWVKTKFLNRQEFVIVGWTDPEGSRSSLGSLLLA
jgi:ATP-dependent DNA ligase